MNTEKSTLKKIQETELEILIKFDEICNKHHLDYVLDSGTLLGAIRHRGFIPWDDDIDVGMPRHDYDIFLEIAQEELGDRYFLQNKKTDPESPYAFSKIRKDGTVFKEYSTRNLRMHQGIFIDVFPYDICEKETFRDQAVRAKKAYKKFLYCFIPDVSGAPQNTFAWHCKQRMRRILHYIYRVAFGRRIESELSTILRLNEGIDMPSYYSCFFYNKPVLFAKEDIYPLKRIKFEGYDLNVPCNSEKILMEMYGDYMKLPPVEQRRTHHPQEIVLE